MPGDDADACEGHPGDLSEAETLARLTVEEKKAIAGPAIKEFPHLSTGMIVGWSRDYDVEIASTAGEHQQVDTLLDGLERAVETGEEPEALDHFIYGYLYPANLRDLGIDPEELVGRDPLERWEGVYPGVYGGDD